MPLSHNSRTTTNPAYVLHRWYCRGWLENSFHQDRTHAEWFFPLVNPQWSSDGTYWVAARCVTEAFSATCAVHIEDCGGWCLSGWCGSVTEDWRLKPEVSCMGSTPGNHWPLTFLYFRLITTKFLYLQHDMQDALSSITIIPVTLLLISDHRTQNLCADLISFIRCFLAFKRSTLHSRAKDCNAIKTCWAQTI